MLKDLWERLGNLRTTIFAIIVGIVMILGTIGVLSPEQVEDLPVWLQAIYDHLREIVGLMAAIIMLFSKDSNPEFVNKFLGAFKVKKEGK